MMNSGGLEAIILAGGLGTRLRDVVKDVPKPMADINGKPFLAYVVEYAASQGVTRVLLSVGYKHEVIQSHFGSSYGGVAVEYVVEEERLGTGGAIREALTRATAEHVVILNGDTFFAADYRGLLRYHLAKTADITIALKPVADLERYGSVLTAPDGRITGFREKAAQGPGNINGGVYVVARARMEGLDRLGKAFSFESDFLQPLAGDLAAYALVCDDYFIDIGIRIDYIKAQQELPQIVRERIF